MTDLHTQIAPLLTGLTTDVHIPVVSPIDANGLFSMSWLMIVLPLAGAVILLLGGRRTNAWGHLLGTAAVLGSFALGLTTLLALMGRDGDDRQVLSHLFTWIDVGGFNIGMDLLVDQLSILFVLLITGVGSLIHIYSIGYMEHDERRRRFFGYLNLFIAAMLTLVLAGNFLVVFLGWEGVGLASYLLIGFWQHKPSAAAAAKKAFVMNRIGDVGLSLAIMLIFVTFGTVSFAGVSAAAEGGSETTMTAIGLLLLLGACGKSAQVPLQAWLLDAMEGPTPVSALIHAATMVTAGVYLITRSNFIFENAPIAQTAVIIVAVVTLLWGAIISCAKDDIKKVLAGSTMSQIGYMMLGAGLGPAGYAFAIFHLITHGFFKANMFLGAGSVMHATNDTVDMRRYGALKKALPITFGTFAMGYLAIIGFPGFSGFWSKDKIIEAAFGQSIVIGIAALIGAGVTAFYMTRLMLMTFFTPEPDGSGRWDDNVDPHEAPKVMTFPLIVLAALSVLGGFLLLGNWIVDWLSPVVGVAPHPDLPMPVIVLTLIVVAVVATGVATAWFTIGRTQVPRVAPTDVSIFTRAARADLYGDAINDTLVVTPATHLISGLSAFDTHVIDGAVEGQAAGMGGLARIARKVQNGFVRTYALWILVGACLVVLVMLAVNGL